MGTKFIRTFDKEIAEKLKAAGYVMIDDENKAFTFINAGTLTFSEEERKKVVYSNVLIFGKD